MTIIKYEMQGFSWQAKRQYQQDAMLFNHQVISQSQHVTACISHEINHAWQIAVADGVGSKINSDLASITLLELLNLHFQHHQTYPTLDALQIDLAKQLKKHSIDKASTTLASITYQPNSKHILHIQSLGDSRVYYFSAQLQTWHCLTIDDIVGNKISFSVLDAKKELGAHYYALTGFFSADAKHQVKDKAPTTHTLHAHDALLVCTDGVYNALDANLWSALLPEHDLTEWMRNFAQSLQPKAHDNLSFIVVRAQ